MSGTSGIEPIILHATILLLTGVAAVTDTRKGIIPNSLTLPALAIAPIAHGWANGLQGVLESLIGMLVCALVPLLLFYRGGMAGGDVKLFAALGAVGGLYVGLEIQFMSLVVASIYAIGQLAWNGTLLRSIGNSVFLVINPILPRKWRRTIAPELMHRIRLGAAILCGATIAIAGHHRALWG